MSKWHVLGQPALISTLVNPSGGIACRSLGFSFCAVLSSLVLCLTHSSCLGLPSTFLLKLGFLSCCPLLYHGLETLWSQESGEIQGLHLHFFPSIMDHSPSLFDISCLKNCCYTYIFTWFSVVSGRKVNLVFVTPSWPEFKILFYTLNMVQNLYSWFSLSERQPIF